MRRQLFAFLVLAGCTTAPPGSSKLGKAPADSPVPDGGFTKPMFSLGGLQYTMTVETELDYFNAQVGTATAGIAIAAQSCSTCKVSPAYNPGGDYDKMATDQNKTAMGFAPDLSPFSGKVFKDSVWIQGDFVDVNLVSISSATYFDPMVPIEGFIGFGPDAALPAGTDNYVTATLTAIGDSTVPNQVAFLPCAGQMWFAGFDPTINTNDPMVDPPTMGFTDMATISASSPFYSVAISDFALGGTAFGETTASFGGAIVALESSISFVPAGVETKLLTSINNDAGFQSLFVGATLADDPFGPTGCVTNVATSDAEVNATLPKFTVTFPQSGGGTFSVDLNPTESYLYSDGAGDYCLTFSSSGAVTNGSQIGATLLNGMFTVFDNDAKQIGFAPELACQAPPAASPRTSRPRIPARSGPRVEPVLPSTPARALAASRSAQRCAHRAAHAHLVGAVGERELHREAGALAGLPVDDAARDLEWVAVFALGRDAHDDALGGRRRLGRDEHAELGELDCDRAAPAQAGLELDGQLDREPLHAPRQVRHALAARVAHDELADVRLVGRELERDERGRAGLDRGDTRMVAERPRGIHELELDREASADASAAQHVRAGADQVIAQRLARRLAGGKERLAVGPRDAEVLARRRHVVSSPRPRSMTRASSSSSW